MEFVRPDEKVTIAGHLGKMHDALQAKRPFHEWADDLAWLIDYESTNGFWDNNRILQTNGRGGFSSFLLQRELEEKKVEQNDELNGRIEEAKALKTQLSMLLTDVEQLKKKLQTENEVLQNSNARAEASIAQVRQAEVDSASISGKIETLYKQLTANAEASQKAFELDRMRFVELSSTSNDLKQQFEGAMVGLNNIRNEFNTVLSSAQESEKHILDQKDAIAELRGFAADGALGGVFDRRRKQLSKTVLLWIAISAIAAVTGGSWIIQVVHDYPVHDSVTGIDWGAVLTNSLRSFPALIVVYFCLAQYTKERNLEEEYAFKAAVSMSITAYASMVGMNDERTKMLIATVQGVYTPPSLGKPFRPFSFRTKDMVEISKSLAEVSKSVQSIAADNLKAKQESDSEKDKK